MSRKVTVEELREKFEQIIAEVEAGESVTIVRDRKALESPAVAQRGERPLHEFIRNFDPGPRPKNLRSNSTDLIREDRDSELRKYGK